MEYAEGYGALLRLRRDPAALMGDVGRRSVDLWRLKVAGHELVVVNEPELIRDVLVTHDWNFVKGRGLQASKPILGEGLLTSEGELHRHERRLAQPAFHAARLASYAEEMVRVADETARRWRHDAVVDVGAEMMRLTLRIVGLTLFSADVTEEAATVGEGLTRALELFQQLNSPLVQAVGPLRRLHEKRARAVRRRLAGVLEEMIAAHRREPARYDDMLSMLMRSHQESGAGFMSDELLLDECLTLFLAGHETTANALTWTWYLLSHNPECAVRLAAEVEAVLGQGPQPGSSPQPGEGPQFSQGRQQGEMPRAGSGAAAGGVAAAGWRLPGMEDMARLPYATAVIRESLRLFPPAWVMAREAVTPYRLGEMQVDAGANLLLSPFATHRDPRWWPEPERFLPERWMVGEEATPRPRFAYFPFGAGSRVCIGEHFALMEAVLVLATLARRWRLELVEGQRVRMWPQLTLRPRYAMRMRLEERGRW